MTKTAQILSMLCIPLVNTQAYFLLILKCWIKGCVLTLVYFVDHKGMEIVFIKELFEADFLVEE
jgi:hypothetical protein